MFKPLPVDDPKVRQPDITKAKAKLGWEPRVRLEDGLAKTIEYFRGLAAALIQARLADSERRARNAAPRTTAVASETRPPQRKDIGR